VVEVVDLALDASNRESRPAQGGGGNRTDVRVPSRRATPHPASSAAQDVVEKGRSVILRLFATPRHVLPETRHRRARPISLDDRLPPRYEFRRDRFPASGIPLRRQRRAGSLIGHAL